MQKIYCLLFAVLFAQASYAASCVSVKQVSANYATKQVTFDVVWSTCTGTHNYKTWVIVDYRTVNANGTKGVWTRAAISGTSVGTLVSASKGVWVTGSASKTQRVTFTLSGMPARYDWCANALDYPPQAIMSNGTYTLKGTSPFTINGSTTLGANVKTYTGACVTSVTDVTNNPEGVGTNPACTAGAMASTGQALCSGSAYTTIGSTTAASGGDGRITYQWLRNGSVISGATATTYLPTQAGTYTRQAKDGMCNTAWVTSSGSWVVTVVSIPAVPTLTATNPCYGTAITFTSSSVSGATGYQWTGAGVTASSGTARTKASKATTAGSYIAQVRAYKTASGITCYSAYTSNFTGVINNGTTTRDAAPNSCGCAINLMLCNGVCRDLAIDEAFCHNDLEVKNKDAGRPSSGPNSLCPAGWRWPSPEELWALCQAGKLYKEEQHRAWWGNRTYDGVNWYVIDCAPDLTRISYCAPWYCTGEQWVRCVR